MKFLRMLFASILVLILTLSLTTCSSSNSSDNNTLGQVTDYRFNRVQQLVTNGPAPDFQMRLPNDEVKFLSDLRDQVVLINFWAVSCPYCVYEMPFLQSAYEELSAKGIIFIGVNVGEPEKTVTNFLTDKDLTFPIILDPDYYASILYNARYLPVTYLINKAGNIQIVKYGAFSSADQVTQMLKSIIE